MLDINNVIKSGELSYLKSIKCMAQKIDTCIETSKENHRKRSTDAKIFGQIDPTTLSSHPQNRSNIVHFFGSTQDEFYNGVSLYYMRGAYKTLSREKSHQCLVCITTYFCTATQMGPGVFLLLWMTMEFILLREYHSRL